MAKIQWTDITREDVIKAIANFHAENPEYPSSKSTFLIYEGKKLPAKHIRAMAYKAGFGKEISKSEFGGGMETVRFFERLGFEMHYIGKSSQTKSKTTKNNKEMMNKNKSPKPVQSKPSNTKTMIKPYKTIKITSKLVTEQKNALQLLLNKIFDGDIVM